MVQVNEELKSLSVANDENSSGKNYEMLIEIKDDRLGGICACLASFDVIYLNKC